MMYTEISPLYISALYTHSSSVSIFTPITTLSSLYTFYKGCTVTSKTRDMTIVFDPDKSVTYQGFQACVCSACKSPYFIYSNRPFIPANDYSEFHFITCIVVRWNEWPVGITYNHTALFRSILLVLSPFSFWEFINVFPHTALFSC